MIGNVVIILSFLSGALYGMEIDLGKRVITGQDLCPKDQFSLVLPPSAHNRIGWLKPYVRKACYGALPSLAACADMSVPMPLSTNFTGNMTEYNVTAEYIIVGTIGGLITVSAGIGLCGWAYMRKERRMNEYKVVEADRRCQDEMERKKITQTPVVDINPLLLPSGAHYRSGDKDNRGDDDSNS
jgi:hypothetical protein